MLFLGIMLILPWVQLRHCWVNVMSGECRFILALCFVVCCTLPTIGVVIQS